MVELMVAMTLGMLIIASVGYAYLGSRQSFRTMETLSRMQENARFAFESVAYDLRMAGFLGCPSSTQTNALNNGSDWDKNLFGQPLLGYEGGAGLPAAITGELAGRDGLTVLRADNANEFIIDSHTVPSAQLKLTANHNIKQGEILVACDNTHATVFQMTNVNLNDTIDVVVHNTGTGVPGNYTKGFGIPVGADSPFDPWASCEANPSEPWCGDTNGTAYAYAPGSRLFRLSARTYYVGSNAAGEPTLYREKLGAAGGNASLSAEEVAEGVEDMQITYGVDTSAPADGAVDAYVTADTVADWTRVLSLRISLLMVTHQNEAVTSTPQAYTYNGATVTPTDRRLRKVFTTVIALRNRL
jgi:type IV pilus assembly protein PilW